MALLYLVGQNEENSELDLLLKDNLLSMGSAVTSAQGSLAWIEAYAIANCQMAALNFIRLLSNQLTPTQMSVFARRFAAIYNLNATGTNVIPDNLPQLQETIALKEALFGTPNTFSNVYQYISAVLGQIFIDLEFNYQIQNTASGFIPPQTPPLPWFSPLSIMYVREWQPRDNQDNILMPTPLFLTTKNSYKAFVQEWLPAYGAVQNMQLLYTGNDTVAPQYGTSNTITAVAGANVITGNGGCAFETDLAAVANGLLLPIEVVDDLNQVHTYHVTQVIDNNHVVIKENVINAITARSYRLLGIQMDVNYALDNMLFGDLPFEG